MTDYDKLGAFYLGRPYDLEAGQKKEGLLLYDSKDLVTHAACFGMTGSGKTGLCTVLLEEALIDGIPALVIDPKGDLANLLLTFPELRATDFEPWIPEGLIGKDGLTREACSTQQAQLWKKGLASWGQDGDRIRRLRDAAEFTVYTPGSQAGIPVSLLKSLNAPSAEIRDDRELLREQIMATVTSLLGLLGVEADPVQSQEHILLSMIFDQAWTEGRDLELSALIPQIQSPPFQRVGMFDLESFYPSKDRLKLAMLFNNVLASPGFEAWLTGAPLDIDRMFYTETGKPRLSILSIAHLNDTERMFFVSMLLNQVVSWMRRQSGTTSLRALLYMDEIAGYFPPVATPPSKAPLMTLLKQARAFGLGVVLATQNPVDLDYKALGNTGTWFIGRLQTERDQMRVLNGLAGAVAGSGREFDRSAMEKKIAGLGKRVFLMYNVHEEAPETFETRWAMSYLRGPLTNKQIKLLMAGRRQAWLGNFGATDESPDLSSSQDPPLLPANIPQCFLPVRQPAPAQASLIYEAALLGSGQVRFVDSRSKTDHSRDVTLVTPFQDQPVPVDWEESSPLHLDDSELESAPRTEAQYGHLPAKAVQARRFATWGKKFVQWLYSSQCLQLFRSPSLNQLSRPGESERDFRIRLEVLAREQRDILTEKLRKKFATKTARLEERIRRAEAAVDREKEQAKQQKLQSTISIGATLLGAFLGRKVVSRSTVGSAGTALRSVSRASKEAGDVARAKENLVAYGKQLAQFEEEFRIETEKIEDRIDPVTETFEMVEIRARKMNISTRLISLAWLPYWRDSQGRSTPAWKIGQRREQA